MKGKPEIKKALTNNQPDASPVFFYLPAVPRAHAEPCKLLKKIGRRREDEIAMTNFRNNGRVSHFE